MTLSEEVGKLAELRASGALTDEEFVRAKARILDEKSPRADDSTTAAVNSFRRRRADRVLGGVCGGVARATGVDAWVWRLLFVLMFVCAGAGLLVYLLLWIFVPSD